MQFKDCNSGLQLWNRRIAQHWPQGEDGDKVAALMTGRGHLQPRTSLWMKGEMTRSTVDWTLRPTHETTEPTSSATIRRAGAAESASLFRIFFMVFCATA